MTYSGKGSHKVVDVNVRLLCIDIRSNLKKILSNRCDIVELKQSLWLERFQEASPIFQKQLHFPNNKQALKITGQVGRGNSSLK